MHQRLQRKQAIVLFLAILCAALPFSLAAAGAQFTSSPLNIAVYADGAILASQAIQVPSSASNITIPLLSSVVAGMVVTDQSSAPLSYSISGGNMTIYTLGATKASINYETQSLISKNGSVWYLSFSTPFNSTVAFPIGASITYISQPASSTNQTNGGETFLNLVPGAWIIKYGLPPESMADPTTNIDPMAVTPPNTTGGSTSPNSSFSSSSNTPMMYLFGGGVLSVALVASAVFLRNRRRTGGGDLRPDDVKVLNFMNERGGKILGVEIRTMFGVPKTSAWRQVRRLEGLGYVKTTKLGSEMQIELVRTASEIRSPS